jgi:protein XagA
VYGVRIGLGTIVGIGVISYSFEVHAGAWTLDEGHGQVVVTATASAATESFDHTRKLVATPRYSKFEFQGLFEYGVRDWFTAILSPGFQHVDIAAPVDARRTGLGYTEFGGRYRIMYGDNWVFSAQATARIPGTFDAANPAAIGYNGMEQDFRLLYGYSFSIGSMPAYIDVQLAQRMRSGDPPNEVRADFTVGVRPQPQWLVLAQLFNVVSEGASPPIYPSYDYSKFQLSVIYDLSKTWSLQAGGFTTYHGRNALQENGGLAGVWYRF